LEQRGVADLTGERVGGIGRQHDHAARADDLGRLANQSRLRLFGVKREELSHVSTVVVTGRARGAVQLPIWADDSSRTHTGSRSGGSGLQRPRSTGLSLSPWKSDAREASRPRWRARAAKRRISSSLCAPDTTSTASPPAATKLSNRRVMSAVDSR